MESFGNIHVLNELNGDKINRLENILTLRSEFHFAFDCLALWFEAIFRLVELDPDVNTD